MGGITNYFHGEIGQVAGHYWAYADRKLWRVLELARNPYRRFAFDYQSDIRIDPAILPGDPVVYVRFDGTCGLWVREGEQNYPGLSEAFDRRHQLEGIFDSAGRGEEAARAATAASGVDAPFVTEHPAEAAGGDSPSVDANFFISYSRWNALAARQVQRSLTRHAKVKVWFDLARPGEAPNHGDAIEEWLRRAIAAANGLLVLLTRNSLSSGWVAKELESASRRARADRSFNVILLKMDASAVPPEIAALGTIVDADNLWYAQGLNEEIFAAIHGYQGRRAWYDANASHPAMGTVHEERLRYDDWVLPSGIAKSFRWRVENGVLHWRLEYLPPTGVEQTVTGRWGPEEAAREDRLRSTMVDFGIREGDRVGAVKVFETPLTLSPIAPTVWMRSEKLDLDPAQVSGWYLFHKPWVAQHYRPHAGDLAALSLDGDEDALAGPLAEALHDARCAELMSQGMSWQPFGAGHPMGPLLLPFASLDRRMREQLIAAARDVLAAKGREH